MLKMLNKIKSILYKIHTIDQLKISPEQLDPNIFNIVDLRIRYLMAVNKADLAKKNQLPADDHFQLINPESFENYLAKLAAINPELFSLWFTLFENGKRSYLEQKNASCSVASNNFALAFKTFVNLHRTGRILDIGCGIYDLPAYLEDCPSQLISAIEPLPMVGTPRFQVIQGFAEFLPWASESFGTIIAATSLDHVLCLNTSLTEIRRVLRKDGLFLVWIGAVPGAKPFNPEQKPYQAIDDFHLFHFDISWFEDLILPYFTIQDKLIFHTASFSHVFYALSPLILGE